jgi:cytoskeletal protein CcmA (bactofilin family)
VVSGGSVSVSAPVGDDLYAAGGRVLVEATIAGNARLAGGEVEVARGARISGKTTIAGRTVRMAGRAGQQLSVAAYSAAIDGEVGGNVTVAARQLTIGPEARIAGKLTYRGPGAPVVASGAVISGGVNQVDSSLDEGLMPMSRAGGWAVAIAFTLGLFFLGLLGLVLAPFATQKVGLLVRSRQFACLGMGLVMVLGVPVAIAVLAMTVIGIPIALVLLLAWPLMLVFGYLAGVTSITDAIAGASRKKLPGNGLRVFVLALGLAGMLAFCTVPVIGWVLGAVLTLAGVGAMTLAALHERFPSRLEDVDVELRSDEVVFRREPTLRF